MEKDVSRLAVEKAVKVLMAARARLKQSLPYGPRKVGMNMKEVRRRLKKDPSPSFIKNLVRQIGEQATNELLLGESLAAQDR